MRLLEFLMFGVVMLLLVLVLTGPWQESAAKRGAPLVNGAPSVVAGASLVGGGT